MATRTAVLGATTLVGRDLLERLEAAGVALGTLALAEPEADAAIIAAVGAELRLSTPRVDEALDGADLVLCCTTLSSGTRRSVEAAAASARVIDLTGTLEGRLFDARRPSPDLTGPGVLVSPFGASLLLAALSRSAEAAGGRSAVAVVLEPASELGKDAVDELYEQAVAILNFQPVPSAIFGQQAVHDVSSPGARGREREGLLRRQVARLLGRPAPSLLLARPGTFHGVAVAFRADVGAEAWRRAMNGEPRLSITDDAASATPARSVQAESGVVGRVEDDGLGGAWAWAAADTLTQGAVGNVVELLTKG